MSGIHLIGLIDIMNNPPTNNNIIVVDCDRGISMGMPDAVKYVLLSLV